MTLCQMSSSYREDARVFSERITLLYAQLRGEESREERRRLLRRIDELRQIRRQSEELAELTERYYERSYYRDERYTM